MSPFIGHLDYNCKLTEIILLKGSLTREPNKPC